MSHLKQHLTIDTTDLQVYGEVEWKVKKHGMDGKRRVWRKLHIAVDTNTHEIIDADLNTDGEIISNLLKQTHRSTLAGYGDCAYDTRTCHATIRLNEPLLLFYQEEELLFL